MHIKLLQENFRSALTSVTKAVSSRPSLPILGSVLINVTENEIEIAATDLFLGIKAKVAGKVLTAGSVAIPARLLSESISSLPAGELDISVEGSSVIITSDVGTLKVSCFDGAEYPPFPDTAGAAVSAKTAVWEKALNQVGFAVGNDPSRPLLAALLFETGEGVPRVVGTDGFRLAVMELPELAEIMTQRLLIPARAVQEVVKSALSQNLDELQIAIDTAQKQVWWRVGQLDIFVRLLDGEYPPYQKIMPAEFAIQASWDAAEFMDHLKRALIFSRESNYVVKLSFSGNTAQISSRGATAGEYSGTMPITLKAGDSGMIAFNGRYLVDFLQHCDGAQIWFGMNDPLKPAEFHVEGGENYHYIVMPFRTTE